MGMWEIEIARLLRQKWTYRKSRVWIKTRSLLLKFLMNEKFVHIGYWSCNFVTCVLLGRPDFDLRVQYGLERVYESVKRHPGYVLYFSPKFPKIFEWTNPISCVKIVVRIEFRCELKTWHVKGRQLELHNDVTLEWLKCLAQIFRWCKSRKAVKFLKFRLIDFFFSL